MLNDPIVNEIHQPSARHDDGQSRAVLAGYDPDVLARGHVLIVGAGVTGVLMARVLNQLGLTNFTVVERNAEPGGTWYVNQYPGCRVDTPSMLYSYSFDPDPDWPEHFSHQPELLRYVKQTAEQSGLNDRLRLNTEVERMAWSEAAGAWLVDVKDTVTGATEQLTAHAVVAAMGILRVPKLPDIAGRETFAGPALHTALWDKSVAEYTTKLKAAGVQFVDADKAAFYAATQPIRDKYGSKYAALLKRIQDTK